MTLSALQEQDSRLIVPTYARYPVAFVRGEGVYLYDEAGVRYLDFAAGIAVTALGHSDPEWTDAVSDQAGQLCHVSNLFHTEPQLELARRLVEASFADRIFFCNSGTEANEAALKFARKWARTHHGPEKAEILAFEGGFHGRTFGSLSVTHNPKYRQPFAPLVPGVSFAPFNDLAAAEAAISDRTCAVIVEPIQGEGGVHPAKSAFLRGLRALCDQHDALLIFDEIQCGLGRTGQLWAYKAYRVGPDIMTLAKPLAGGLPIGVTLVTEAVAQTIEVGDHGSTFAAGPLVCRAAQVVLDRVAQAGFLQQVRETSGALIAQIRQLPVDHILDVRAMGLLLGIEFDRPVKPLIQAALARGLVLINAGERVLRICPPLVITREQLVAGFSILVESLRALEAADVSD